MIGYIPGTSRLHRAHPYTPLTLAAAVMLLAFAFRSPGPVWLLVLAAAGFAAATGTWRQLLTPALLLAAPTWTALLLLHAVFGEAPRAGIGHLTVSIPGIARALVLGGRIGAIVLASLATLAAVSPARLVDAMTARGAPFGRVFLLVSTLTFLPRTRARAAGILEAQQARGLRLGGRPVERLRALGPLVLPLVLGALAEVDEQVLALEARGATRGGRRTAIDPPADPPAERVVRWLLAALVVAAWVLRLEGRL